MARKQVERTLPALSEAFASFCEFPPGISHQSALLKELRSAARQFRTKDSRPFYAMREVARFFHVPLRTVAIAYEQLELEGLLNRIRGSRTMLVGKTRSPRKPVRGIVGIPLWLHAFVVSPYSRYLHWELEERLRQCGFVADIVFFRGDEVAQAHFTERLLEHNLDYIIWHTPHPRAQQTLLSLKDSGVHQIIVQPADNPTSMPLPTYFQDWRSGYQQMGAHWASSGIRIVLTPKPVYLPSLRALKSFTATLEAAGLEVQLVEPSAEALLRAAQDLPQQDCGVAFLDQLGADTICNENPVEIEKLLEFCRVAFCRGPIHTPYFRHRDAKVDLVRFSPEEAANRIVNDLRDNKIPHPGETPTFHAIYESNLSIMDTYDIL